MGTVCISMRSTFASEVRAGRTHNTAKAAAEMSKPRGAVTSAKLAGIRLRLAAKVDNPPETAANKAQKVMIFSFYNLNTQNHDIWPTIRWDHNAGEKIKISG